MSGHPGSHRLERQTAEGKPSAASFFVTNVPTLPDATRYFETYAGYLPARSPAHEQENAYVYFMLHKAKRNADRRRLLIWLNGGPGCSSFDGVMMEVGPWRTKADGTGLEWAAEGGAWNEYVDVLYIDQPVGTGFSYVSTNAYATSLKQAAEEVRYFLAQFVDVFPQYKRGYGTDTWISGESFAGQYIPYIAEALTENAGSTPVDLKGFAIGNGFIDPRSQYGSELDLLVEKKVWPKTGEEYSKALKAKKACEESMAKTPGNPRSIPICDGFLSYVIDLTKQTTAGKEMCINIYDVRLADTVPACGMNWPPNLHATYDYLHRSDVRAAFHVSETNKPEAWIECNSRVGSALSAANEDASVTLLPDLLERGLQVLIFAGDQDLICNHIGLERMVENLEWGGAKGFRTQSAAAPHQWFVNESLAGTWQSDRNLTYVSLAGGSHMVGFDLPLQSHDMMLRFMDVDLAGAAGPLARIPSRVGNGPGRDLLSSPYAGKLAPPSSGTGASAEEQAATAAKWEAYYQAGSVALVVLLLLVAVGSCVILRQRRQARKSGRLRSTRPSAVRVPDTERDMELDGLVQNADIRDDGDAPNLRHKVDLRDEEQFVLGADR